MNYNDMMHPLYVDHVIVAVDHVIVGVMTSLQGWIM